jgi:hypothetical protein
MPTMNEIDRLARDYRESRDALAVEIRALERAIAAIKVKHAVTLRRLLGAAANRLAKLETAIDESRDLFVKPKTVVLHGLKLGLQKGKGGLDWEDDATVVKLIRKHLPDQFDTLVKVEETPLKTPLSQLEVATLKKLGIEVKGTGDVVLVKPTDADVDKLIKKLAGDAADAKDAEAA